jgi:hypothetical protein
MSHSGAAKAGDYLQQQELIIRRQSGWTLSSGFFQAWLVTEEE